jgi:hypothetical protein
LLQKKKAVNVMNVHSHFLLSIWIGLLSMLAEISRYPFSRRLHGLLTRFPVGGTHLAMLLGELQSI